MFPWYYKLFAPSTILNTIVFAIINFFYPHIIVIGWCILFVMIDALTGIIAAYKQGLEDKNNNVLIDEHVIKSRKLWKTLYKIMGIVITLTMLAALQVQLEAFAPESVFPNLYLTNIVAFAFLSVEYYSVMENLYTITGHKMFKTATRIFKKKIKEKQKDIVDIVDSNDV